ncbi:MAG: L-seryl-tRNA(Sec) selenium transferase [Treponema sp.]|nr:L-seryl-tRNA(Sec) selenium transferase [Treponema sp.]
MAETNELLRALPSMDELSRAPWAQDFSALLGWDFVKKALARALDEARADAALLAGLGRAEASALVEARSRDFLSRKTSSSFSPVINATGVIIHTNLGRAPLAPEAARAAEAAARGYGSLEYSPETGARSRRDLHVEWLICHLTGAEAALVVNNNAAAVLLALSALAAGREAIVSNGELVEIGDGFRVPDILAFSGARMVAVGCTNSTRASDYERAIGENTAALLKVHPSNFRVEGFGASASREELAKIAASRGIAFIEDLGSGLLCPLGQSFARDEPLVSDCVKAGASVVTFSGDKLLGGPQIGVAAGAKALIEKMRRHQLARALRVDKMTLAAFEATLRMYAAGRSGEIPVIAMIEADPNELKKKAANLCRALRKIAREASGALPPRGGIAEMEIETVETQDAIGGGAFATDRLSGFGVAIRPAAMSAENLARAFRAARPPVIPTIRGERVILHMRALLDGDAREIARAFALMLRGESGAK